MSWEKLAWWSTSIIICLFKESKENFFLWSVVNGWIYEVPHRDGNWLGSIKYRGGEGGIWYKDRFLQFLNMCEILWTYPVLDALAILLSNSLTRLHPIPPSSLPMFQSFKNYGRSKFWPVVYVHVCETVRCKIHIPGHLVGHSFPEQPCLQYL